MTDSATQPELVTCHCCKGETTHEVECGPHRGGGAGYPHYYCSTCENEGVVRLRCGFCDAYGKVDPADEWTGQCSVYEDYEVRSDG